MATAQSIVICLDNNCNINSRLLKEQKHLTQRICSRILSDKPSTQIAIMTPISFWHQFMPSPGSIHNHLKQISVSNNDFNLIECLRIGFEELKKVDDLKQRLICFVNNKITNTDEEIGLLAQLIHKGKSRVSIELICFGQRVDENIPKLKVLFTKLNEVYLTVFQLKSNFADDMITELEYMGFFNENLSTGIIQELNLEKLCFRSSPCAQNINAQNKHNLNLNSSMKAYPLEDTSPTTLSAELIGDEEKQLQLAINHSLAENYKQDSDPSVKSEQNSQSVQKIAIIPKKKIKKFRERTKYL